MNFNEVDYQYIDLVRRILTVNELKSNRTSIQTYDIFGVNMRFDVSKKFPLLTTKKIFWRGVVEELLWFLRGETSSKILSDKGVKIWDANGSREFLDSIGFKNREVGDLGPIYGYQWRRWGGKHDQLANCIKLIKNEPNSRRIIMSAWNVDDLDKMVLPPCHVMCQFYVQGDGLSLSWYQRSCDVALGLPFNIASYGLLLYIVAKECGLKPKDLIFNCGSAHIYKTHVEAIRGITVSEMSELPTMNIINYKSIEDLTFENFQLHDYKYTNVIKMDMVA